MVGQVRNAASFLRILTNKSFNAKALPYKCNIIARYTLLLSTNKMEKNNFSKVSLKNSVSNFSENNSVIILSLSSTGEEESEEWRGTFMAGRGKDTLLQQLMDKWLLKRKAYFGEEKLWLKGKVNGKNRLKIKTLVIKEIIFWRIWTETKD